MLLRILAIFTPTVLILLGLTIVIVWLGGVDATGYRLGITVISAGIALCVLVGTPRDFGKFEDLADADGSLSGRKAEASGRSLKHWLLFFVVVAILFLAAFGRCALDGLALSSVLPAGLRVGMLDCAHSAFPVWTSLVLGTGLVFATKSLSGYQARVLLLGLLGLFVFQILYGHVAWLTAEENIFNIGARVDASFWTGTFGNQNLAAAYIGMATPLALGLVLDRHLVSRTWGVVIGVSLLAAAASALFSTNSRMGAASAMFGLMVFGIGFARGGEDNSRWKTLVVVALPIVVVLIAGIWIGLDSLLQRYLDIGGGNVSRLKLWSGAFDLPVETWLFGIGVGRFYEVYGIVQPTDLSRSFHYMHNDVLQSVLEFGILVSTILSVLVVLLLKKWWPRRWSSICLGAAAGCSAGLVQSLADFPLRVPGTALMFCCLLGIAFNHNIRDRQRAGGKVSAERRPRKRRRRQEAPT